jgi:hypothetical protein
MAEIRPGDPAVGMPPVPQDVNIPPPPVADPVRPSGDAQVDRMQPAGQPAAAQVEAVSPRRSIGQKLGALVRGTLKGAAVLGLAVGLVLGGQYYLNSQNAQAPQQIEQTIKGGGVHDNSLPQGQGPPAVEIDIDVGPGVHKSPTMPRGEGGTTIPAPPAVTVTFDASRGARPMIPIDGGQSPADLLGGQTGGQAGGPTGVLHGNVQGIPGLGNPGGVTLEKPQLQHDPVLHLKPQFGGVDGNQDLTTDPLKGGTRLRPDAFKPKPKLELPTFKPHMLPDQ